MEETNDLVRLTKIKIRMRDAIAKLEADCTREVALVKVQMDQVDSLILQAMGENISIRNQHGTVMKQIRERFWSTDWESFKQFVKENDALDLFEHRIQQKNMAQYLQANPDKLPAGLQVDRRYRVVVRRASGSNNDDNADDN